MSSQNLLLTRENRIAVVTINRPEVLNALNRETVDELDALVDELNRDQELRAVIFTGGEKHFAAGADITAMVEGNPEFARGFVFKDTFNKIDDLSKPTIAAVAGYALGAGMELALACDLRVAKSNVKFGLPEVSIGIMPGAGGTQRLPRLIGAARAKEMIMLGGMVDASTALSYGLVNRVVEENVVEEALKLATKLAALPPIALRSAKQVVNQGQSMELKLAIDLEAMAWASLFATEDQKEGMRAFLEKRKPEFKGR